MLLQKFQRHIKNTFPNIFQVNGTWLLAVSGGIDSVVLCDLVSKTGIDFIIAHCNFQLRNSESERDEGFVKSLAEKYRAEVHVKRFETLEYAEQHKKSIQVAARELRYEWFYQLLNTKRDDDNNEPENDEIILPKKDTNAPRFIVTAHHANDNIETLLMNFFKGTGISGLHGIQPLQNKLLRPLLPFKKDELLAYAEENKLAFVEDSSNQSDKYTRNYLRQHILPSLKELYPQVEDNLLSNIERFAEAGILYDQSIQLHKKKLLETKGSEVHVPVLKLQKCSPLRTIVYEIIKDYGFTSGQVNDVIMLLDSESGKYISSATHRIIKNRKWLIISPNDSSQAGNIIIEKEDTIIHFEGGRLQLEHRTIDADFQIPTSQAVCCVNSGELKFPLILRKWKQGDYFYPLGMKKKKKLSRFFIDKKLSKTEKERVWVLEAERKIVWVVGHRIDERFKLGATTKNISQITLIS